jgi:hypothetical protein
MEAGGGAGFAIEVKKALRYMCTYSSCPLLNLAKNQQVLQTVSLASNLDLILDVACYHVPNYPGRGVKGDFPSAW